MVLSEGSYMLWVKRKYVRTLENLLPEHPRCSSENLPLENTRYVCQENLPREHQKSLSEKLHMPARLSFSVFVRFSVLVKVNQNKYKY